MKNSMKPIMVNWRSYTSLEEKKLLQEQLLLEGFLDSIKSLGSDVKGMFVTISDLLKDPEKIANFVSLLDEKVISPSIDNIKNVFTKIENIFSKDKNNPSTSFISSMIQKINSLIKQSYDYVKNMERRTWKKAISSIGLSIVIKFLSQELFKMPIDAGIEKIVNYFNENIVEFLNNFLGEALVDSLSSALTGGVATFISIFSKIAGGTSFIAKTISPAVKVFQTGGLSLSRFE